MDEACAHTSETIRRPQLLPFVADQHLPYLVPVFVFWVISLLFHYIDTHALLSEYKLHTPAEDLTKNRASKRDVIKFALIQQVAQCTLGYFTAGDQELFAPHEQTIGTWANKIQRAQSYGYQSLLGDKAVLYMAAKKSTRFVFRTMNPTQNVSGVTTHDTLRVEDLNSGLGQLGSWNWAIATLAYWVVIPCCQYITAMVLADTMQYFTHRAFHVNRWLYKNVHSMHHDIYVPFAYGAFYNHPLETIPIDGILFPLCLSIARLDNRQAAFFGAIWTFKTVVDHCGYDFPYNPCNIVCPNSVLYHDLHHQSWGMKFNFSVYASVWDKLMGTHWSPYDDKAQEKYSRSKNNAEVSLSKPKYRGTSKGESSAVDLGSKPAPEVM